MPVGRLRRRAYAGKVLPKKRYERTSSPKLEAKPALVNGSLSLLRWVRALTWIVREGR
jgi:hypothetical protein